MLHSTHLEIWCSMVLLPSRWLPESETQRFSLSMDFEILKQDTVLYIGTTPHPRMQWSPPALWNIFSRQSHGIPTLINISTFATISCWVGGLFIGTIRLHFRGCELPLPGGSTNDKWRVRLGSPNPRSEGGEHIPPKLEHFLKAHSRLKKKKTPPSSSSSSSSSTTTTTSTTWNNQQQTKKNNKQQTANKEERPTTTRTRNNEEQDTNKQQTANKHHHHDHHHHHHHHQQQQQQRMNQ